MHSAALNSPSALISIRFFKNDVFPTPTSPIRIIGLWEVASPRALMLKSEVFPFLGFTLSIRLDGSP